MAIAPRRWLALLLVAAALPTGGASLSAQMMNEARDRMMRSSAAGDHTDIRPRSANRQPGGSDALAAHLSNGPFEPAPTGLRPLDERGERAAMLYVPPSYQPGRPAPFILLLHGAGGLGAEAIAPMQRYADARGAILLAPTSQDVSWDFIRQRRYGPDVKAIDGLLARVFAQYAIDPDRVTIAGFSDGASYALSLGLANGALFRNVIAFSPGFMAPNRSRGQPRIFISHGTDDTVLPIETGGRRIAQQLEKVGRKPRFVEFKGGHRVPAEIVEQAFAWLMGPTA